MPEPPVPTQDVAVPPTAVELQAGAFTISVVDAIGEEIPDDIAATISFTSDESGLVTTDGNALTDEDKTVLGSTFGYSLESIPADGVSYSFVVSAEGYLSNSGTITLSTTDNVAACLLYTSPSPRD